MHILEKKLDRIRGLYPLFDEKNYQHFTTPDRMEVPMYLKRILTETEFCYRMLRAGAVQDDTALNRAVDTLLSGIETDGTITKETALTAEEQLLPYQESAKEYKVHAVAHAHIDMNWQWPWHETVSVTLETFRTMLNLMREYPDFTFSQSQASCYHIVEQFDPDMLEEIRQRVHEGRWEVTASSWVENDHNMPNLESFANHLLYTKKYLSALLGIDPESLNIDYEPDTFGHAATLPEIMEKGGVKYFYHCRGYQDEAIYNWEAPSGKQLLAYCDPTWYLADMYPGRMLHVPEFCARYGTTEYLRVYGVGDHGGGPTRRELSYILEMQNWPVFPTIVFSTYQNFFRYLETMRDHFPVVRQELNPVLAGCYTTQSRIKMANRLGEAMLTEAQTVSSMAALVSDQKPDKKAFEEGWRRILFNQFHDILPGSGVRDTREFAMTKFSEAIAYSNTEMLRAMRAIAAEIDTSDIEITEDPFSPSEGGGLAYGAMDYQIPSAERGNGRKRVFHLFNPGAADYKGITMINVWDWPASIESLRFTDASGKPLAHQVLAGPTGWYLFHTCLSVAVDVPVPALGYTTVVLDDGAEIDHTLGLPDDPRVHGQRYDASLRFPNAYVLENEWIHAEFDCHDGQMVSLIDRQTGEELLKGKAGFRYIEEQPEGMESWIVGRYMNREIISKDVRLSPKIVSGPLVSSFTMEFPFGKMSKASATVSLGKNDRFVRYEVKCEMNDFSTPETSIPQLAFAVPFNYPSEQTLYAIPGGTIVRPPLSGDVASQGFAVPLPASGKHAVMLATDSKYGYRTDEGEIQAALVRDACNPDPYSDRGAHQFTITVHAVTDPAPKKMIECARASVRPVHVLSAVSHGGVLKKEMSFFRFESEELVLSSVRPEENGTGTVFRIYDAGEKGGRAVLRFFRKPVSAVRVNLLEQETGEKLTADGENIVLELEPGNVTAILVRF